MLLQDGFVSPSSHVGQRGQVAVLALKLTNFDVFFHLAGRTEQRVLPHAHLVHLHTQRGWMCKLKSKM